MSILSRPRNLIRRPPPPLDQAPGVPSAAKVPRMVRALTGDRDHDLVRESMIERYAQVIVPTKDEVSGAETNQMYRANSRLKLDYAAKEAILAGQQEITRLYLFPSVVRQRATLFGEPTQQWSYDVDSVAEVIGEVREDSACHIALQRWDSFADGIGSCALYMSLAGDRVNYAPITPDQIHAVYAEEIEDDGQLRAVDETNLDEASVVVIEVAPAGDRTRWAAWYGPSTDYPLGRHVVYTAQEWYDIPAPGEERARDYLANTGGFGTWTGGDELGNPLTLIAKDQGDQSGITYPIAILYGDVLNLGLLPVSCSLYDTSSEIDLMGSMVLGAAGKGARGARALKRGDDPNIPPATDEATVLLGRNQELINVGWPASHSREAMTVITNHMRLVSEAHGVPGWLVVADEAGQVPSGVALAIALQPLNRHRAMRVSINRSSVARKWAIERLIVNGAVGRPQLPYDCRETWDPGERSWPQDPLTEAAAWKARIEMGEASLLDVWREMRGFATDEQALNWATEQVALRAQIPTELTPKPAAAPKLSIAQRLGGGASTSTQQWHREPGPRPDATV